MEKKSIGGEIVVGAQAMGVVRGGGKRGITPPGSGGRGVNPGA